MRLSLRSLPVRLIGLMTLALLPLGLISLYQTRSVIDRAEDLARGALIAEARQAVALERRVLIEAVGAARGLGVALLPLLDDPARCSAVLGEFIDQSNQIVFAGFLPPDGVMRCSSHGEEVDFSDFPGFAELMAAPGLSFEVNEQGAVSGQSVMIANVPIYAAGAFAGYVAISIPHAIVNDLLPSQPAERGLEIVVLNRAGEVISASEGLDGARALLPEALDTGVLRSDGSTTFRGRNQAGEVRVFATFTLLEDEVLVIGSWPVGAIGTAPAQGRMAVLFPLLMWAAGVLVAYFGLHRLVIRHVSALRDAMRRFALGERDVAALQLDAPSTEFAQAQRAFNRMVLILSEAEARREQDLQDKEVLLREVHHRVKNNLQMIASIMNMQSRTVTAPETKRVLQGLQRRVQGLAAIHRTLYTTTEMTCVDVAALADEMVSEVAALAGQGARAVTVRRDLTPLQLYPDQAVPLSMVLSEMLTNAFKYVGRPEDAAARIDVTLKAAPDGRVELAVENTRGTPLGEELDNDSTGIGTRLMRAFVMQLDGVEEVEDLPDSYRMVVRFRPAEFVPDAA